MENIPARSIGALLIFFAFAGLLTVALTSANSDRRPFAATNKLIHLEAALENYRIDKNGMPSKIGTPELVAHLKRVYGEEVANNPKIGEIDRAELLTMLLSQKTWPIARTKTEIYFDFDERRLFDSDGDGWLEYRYQDNRLFLLRNGEACLWNEKTNRYQFSE